MIRLAAVLIVLVLACLVTVSYPVFAQGPPEDESGGVSSSGKSDSGISQLLLDSINERGSGGTQQRAVTRDAVTRDSSEGGTADAGVVGSSGTGGREELLSGVSKDDSETSRTAGDLVRFDGSGNVEVYIHLQSTDEASLQQVRDAVEKVEIEGAEYGLLQAWVDPDNLGAVASLEAVKRITSPDYGYTKKGSTLTEGDAVHRANLVRAFSGLSGEGVKVGVISNGVDAWTSARSRGDLPSRIEINPNQDSEGHEGTALLEIIHDIAPDAELAFSGSESSLGMAQAILWLANGAFDGEGADVIVDDLGYFLQPFFEDGIIAQAAADAVAGGAVFASAAGNYAQEHYEGDFVDGGDSFHAFDGSSDITMRLFSPFGAFVILQWNDEFGASGNDYDLYICPAGLTPTTFNLFNGICDASTDLQNGNDDPLEVASLYVEGEVDVFIKKDSGQNRRLEMFFIDSYAREYGVEEGGIVHHVAVPGVLAVGAVDADDPGNDDLRSYSDLGPSRIYFPSLETRQKPDVVASDGVSVTGSGGFRSHFNGTSAAAPHVAGIAALLIEAQRLADSTMTKKQVADAVTQKIRDTAIDLGPSGHDNKFGYGRADALAGVESLDQLSATTFTVNSTGDGADSNTRDGVCDDGNGNCTLRAAIQEANRVDGSFIEFNISGGGTRTIQPASSLPTITRTVLIDGFSQSGASSSNYRIELDGTNAGTNSNGLTISGTETWVRGLVINRFGGNGIVLQGSGGKQVIEENRIGTNASGSSDSGNGKAGVLVSGADGVELRNNLNSGNDGHGVELSGGADDVIIDGNIIGANVSGTSDLGNTGSGIHISNGDGAKIANNVIAGNDSHGVSLTGSSTYDNVVAENYIGVNESGASIANSGSGVHIGNGADDNTVEHNTIAHNTGDGATVVSSSATGNTVWENSMYSNGGLGIDLGDKGVTANDANDRDSGPNNLQNYAVLTSAGLSSDAGSIGFNLYVTQGNRYTVDFYASDSCDGSGNGEGKEWLGFAWVVLATFGDRHFVVNTFRGTLNQYDYPSGTYITATVTLDGSTSEFSPCVQRTALPRLALSEDAIEVEEDGTTTTTYTVRLSSRPSHDATVDLTIQGDEAVTVSPTPLTFTTSNWDNTQTVTVTAVSDDDPEDEFTVIQHKMTIDSKQYVSEWLPVTVVDYDVPDVALVLGGTNRLTGFVRMEEGQSATYPVVLTAEPDDDVTVSIYSSSSSALRVSTSSLTFTKDNYDTAQNVTITARNDSDAEDELVNVYHEVLIDGSYYEVARVQAFIIDPIFPRLTLSDDTLSVNESETATYTIVPEAEPSRNFTITLASSDTESVTVSPPNVTFTRGTNGNWQTPKTITVTGVQDDDEFDDVAFIRHLSTYSGIEYRLGSGVEVTVADGNRAPFFEEGVKITRTVPENSPQGTNVGEPVIATDLNGDTLTYTIEDQVGGPYEVDNSGQITVGAGANLDYESRTAQEVKLGVQDTDGLSDTIEVQIEITDVNEPPVITGTEDLEWQENRTGNIARFRATDPERDTFEWDLIGRDRTFFSIDSRGYLTFIEPPDFEDKVDANGDGIYELTVVARDTAGQFGTLDIKVTITNANEPPTVTGDDDITIDENTDTFSRAYSASDPEGVAFTWSLSGTDWGDFNIDSNTGELTFRNTPNYESPADSNRDNEYLVQVRATDEGNLRGILDVTVTVNDINEPPTISGDDTLSYPENTKTSRVLDRYTASDPERRPITWSIAGTDNGAFAIDSSGNLRFSSQPDHETPTDSGGNNVYDIQVVATDDGNNGDGTQSQLGTLSAYFDVSVTVTPVNEPPTVTGDFQPSVNENTEDFSRTYTASDPEGVASTFTWSLSGTDSGDFNIGRSTGELTYRNTPDYESPTDSNRDNEYLVQVRATDEGNLRGELKVTVTVNDLNEAPEFTSSSKSRTSFSYPENETSVLYTYQATDPERGTITWSVSGTDDDDFDITSDSRGRGVLAFANVPDFENPADSNGDNDYLVTIEAYDGRHTATLEVVVTVTNSSGTEEPTITTTSRPVLTYQENGTGTVYTFRATDPQRGAITWTLDGDDRGDFTITRDSSGLGVLAFTSPPDFENPDDSDRDNVYEITVVVTDDQGLTDSFDVTIIVTNHHENLEPAITTSPSSGLTYQQLNYQENRTATVYTYRATNYGSGSISWSVTGTDAGDFTITSDSSNRGVLTFGSTPDFESPDDLNNDNDYEFTVVVANAGGYSDRLDVVVTVTDVNEGPEINLEGSAPGNVPENQVQDTVLARYRAADPEDPTVQITRWGTSGTDGGDFVMNEQGELRFRYVPDYERPADSNQDNEYLFTVRASDGRYYGYLEVMVTVTPVNEPPTITTTSSSATGLRQSENQTSRLYTYRATDPEGATIRWLVGGTDERFFTINERGEFSFNENNPPDYEIPEDSGGDNVYEVTIQARDDGFNTDSLPVTVTVREINEGPEVTSGQATFTISENQDLPNAVYSGFDPEGGTVTRWTVGGRDGGDFTITQDGLLTFRSLPDYDRPADSNRDNVYELEVRPYDGRYYGSFDVTVTVTPVNEHDPVIRSGSRTSFTYREDSTSTLYTYSATDGDKDDVITWTAGGTDGHLFEFNDRNALVFREAPDYENPRDSGMDYGYNLTVVATDSGGRSASLPVTVTLTGVNESPEVSGPATFTIAENQNLSNSAYTATDPEGFNVALWSVGGRDGGDFFITQGGTLFFRYSPDYERPADADRNNVYEASIQPSDGRNTGTFAVTVTVTGVNEPPEIRSGSTTSFTQPENRTSRLYTYSATDPEGSDITWSVGGTDGSHFTINKQGQFSFREDNPPDFDTPGDVGEDNLYNVTIEARDDQPNTASLPVVVMVTEVNEGPAITRQGNAPGSVPENHGVDQVLATYTATDPERPTVKITQWSTSGRDGGDFVIDALGQLKFRSLPDYERPADSDRDNVYEVTIRASDGRNTGTLEEIQMVTVTDVNEAPTITTTSRTEFSQQENRTSTLYTFRATDPEGGTVTWAAAGTDGGFFTIDERGQFSFMETSPPDFDAPGDEGRDNVYDVEVQARDPEGNTSEPLPVTVTVTNNNEGVEPTISTRRPPTTYRENGTSTVYTFRASDPQRETSISWSLEGTDRGDFSISETGALTFNDPPDFERPADSNGDNEYELVVVATDDEGNTDRVAFTITVTNDAEGVEPNISTRRPPTTYRENGTSTIYTFRASDPQRGAISWSLRETVGSDFSDFSISETGALTFNSPPDFESPADANMDNEYELTVVATDEEGHTDSVTFTITVTDIDEGPEISLQGTATTSVPENYADTQVLARYRASDPENPNAGIFRWSTSGRDGGDFVINELGELRFRNPPDYERPADSNGDNIYEVTVRASDGRTYGTLEEPLIVTVTEVNEAPVITTKSRTEFTQRENTTAVLYTYRATDQDVNDAIRWSVEGADGEDFAIYNGVLTFRLLPDYELPVDSDRDNEYRITVVAADRAGLRDTVDAIITITDQPEGPVIAGRRAFTVTENYDMAQPLGSYTATDAKDMRPVYPRWSLTGRDGGDFVIDPATGSLTFRNTPDYDRPADGNRDNRYEVTVRGYDGRAYGNLDVTVIVTNINEGAPVVTGRTSHNVRENTTTAIYTYRATDSDLNDTITWSTGGVDGHLFEMSDRGELSFRAEPDFETPRDTGQDNVYDLEVVATDGQGLRGILAVTVTVTELNEGPVVSGQSTFTITENRDLPSAIYSARDPEATVGVTSSITWSTSGRDGGDFTIDRENGELTFSSPPDYERPADSNRDNEYEVTVRAYDGRNYGSHDVTVTVEDANEISGPTTLVRSENFEGVLPTYSAVGQGGLNVVPAWRLTGTDSGDFNISEVGELTFRSTPDYERPADSNRDNVYNFAVQVSDGSYYGTLDVAVTVEAVNERPVISGRDSLSFRENTPTTTRLYTYSARDAEGDDFTWHLGGLDAGDFTITADSSGRGMLFFAAPPNFDNPAGSGMDGNEYLVTVQARDAQGNGELPVTITITDQNEGANVSGDTTIAVQENRDPTLTLATYSATDPENPTARITRWSTSGTDGGDFWISENGELTFRNTPDFDRPADSNRDNEYLVTVRAYDGRVYGNLDVTITVSNQNEHAPVIRSGSRTSHTYREENTSAIYTYSATDQDKDDVIAWTTGGTDGNLFEFDDRNGLVFREPPDYENPGDAGGDNEYELTVIATDSGGRSDSLGVTVTVTEFNEGPEVTGTGTATYTVTEGGTLSGATFTARDPEEPTSAVSRWSLAGSDGGDFIITETGQNGAELTFRNTPDYDSPADSNRDNEYLVTIRAYNGSTYGSLDVKVTVTDENEAEPVVSGRETLSFSENYERTLYTYRATDMDRDTTIVWLLEGDDRDDFEIAEGVLTFKEEPDYEDSDDANDDNVYEITVVASDGTNHGTLDVTITVTDVNEGPEVAGQATRTVSEDFDQVLATYTGKDPEDTTADITRWSVIGRDGGDFTINEDGELTFRNPPDFERPADANRDNEYEVTVRASDGRYYGAYDVTVAVEDVNEAPEFRSGSRDSFTYRENGTSALYTYRATDPEGDDFTWSVGGTDGGDFEINEDGGVLTFRTPPDFDNPADDDEDNEYLVTVIARDDRLNAAELEVRVTVTELNEGPVIQESPANTEITVRENSEGVLFTYSATDPEDPDAEITRWSVTGTDGGDFTINEDGELTFRSTPDFERPADSNRDNEYLVTVRASDGRYYGTLEVTVMVEAVDEAPEFWSGSTTQFAYQENGTSDLYTYRATDPEGNNVTWGLSGDDSSAFTISETGVLAFNDPPDYEAPADDGEDNVYQVTVVARDEQNNDRNLEVTVTVTNVTD